MPSQATIEFLQAIIMFLQAIIMFFQWRLSRTIYYNSTFEDKNNCSRDDLSTILFESYAFIEQLNTEFAQGNQNKCNANELFYNFECIAGEVMERIASFQKNFGEQLREDVRESIESLRKVYFEYKKDCLAFNMAERLEENAKFGNQIELKNILQKQITVLEEHTNYLSEITKNKKYLIRH